MRVLDRNILPMMAFMAASSIVTDAFAFTSHRSFCASQYSLYSKPQFASIRSKQYAFFETEQTQLAMKIHMGGKDNEFTQTKRARLVSKVYDRLTDTMTPAGLENPVLANFWAGGPKRFFFLLFTMLGIKWWRSKFLLKQKFTDKIPAWGHVITSKEQEEVLHAWTCKECGTTMFIAKGREIRFFNRFVECYNCGAKGKDSFYDRRAEIVEKDDTDFEYENPMDYISNAERRKLEKQKEKEEEQREKSVDAEIVATAIVEESVAEDVEEYVAEDVEEYVAEDVEESVAEVAAEENEIVSEAAVHVEEETPIIPVQKEYSTPDTDDDGLDVLGMDF